MANNNRLPTIALIKILERIHDKGQRFYLNMVDDPPNSVAYQYKLVEVGADGKNYLLHVEGIRIEPRHYSKILDQVVEEKVFTHERIVNLAHVVGIYPCKVPAA